VVLEVDHIEPKAKGGKDIMNNLQTACFDCNRGKRDMRLDQVSPGWKDRAALVREREKQLEQYNRLLKEQRERTDIEMADVEDLFISFYENYSFSDSFRASVRRFLGKLPLIVVLDAMEIACYRGLAPEQALKYFCGICWRRIRGEDV